MKKCCKCNEIKDFSFFSKSKNRKDGLHPQCKDCTKKWREENKEKLSLAKKEYYYKDHDAMKKKLRERYADDPRKVIKSQQEYYSTEAGRKKKILAKARENAKKKGIEFNIDLEDIIIPEYCPYLKIPLTHDLGKGQIKSNSSIDRIDPAKGYIKGNVQIISRQANTMKSDATPEQLRTFALSILEGTTLDKYVEVFKEFV